jgi:hypothetical protein
MIPMLRLANKRTSTGTRPLVPAVQKALAAYCCRNRLPSPKLSPAKHNLLFTWMANPDLLSCTMTVTFFSSKVGWASVSRGPLLADAPHALPPEGKDVLLIHLDHYSDWSP